MKSGPILLLLACLGCSDGPTGNGLDNRPPVAVIDSSLRFLRPGVPTEVTLSAARSSDPNGDELEYEWTIQPGTQVLEGSSGAVEIVLILVSEPGECAGDPAGCVGPRRPG